MSDDASSGLEEGANIDRASLLKRLAIGGAALSLPSLVGAEAAFGSVQDVAASAAAVWPKHPKWKFALINHVTTNPFFVPTQYGAADAAKMLDVSYTWSGSTKADVGEMINAFNAAISAKADGIAVCVVDKGAFEAPIKRALGRGIPVVAYNADGARTGSKARQAYIGQDLYVSGFEMGKRIRRARAQGRRCDLHRDARGAQHPTPNRRRARGDQAVGEAREGEGDRHEPGPRPGALDDRRVLRRPQEPEGHVRGRRGRHAGRRVRSSRSTSCRAR